jgi:putative transposase
MGIAKILSHTCWECKYHLVWIPKCLRKTLCGQLRKHLGEVLHDLAFQKESRILEGHLQTDHVHMLVSIPTKYYAKKTILRCLLTILTSTPFRIFLDNYCLSSHEWTKSIRNCRT